MVRLLAAAATLVLIASPAVAHPKRVGHGHRQAAHGHAHGRHAR